jgi:hypothetical protein
MDPAKYYLTTTEGRFTRNALAAFLKYREKYHGLTGWNQQHVCEASELDGVCAYNNPQGAFDYACLVPACQLRSLDIVEFVGSEECVLPAEKDEGGVIVKIVSEIEFYRVTDFKHKFRVVVNPDLFQLRPWLTQLQ